MSDAALQHDKQIMLRKHLHGRGILDARVLDAMARVPRERFLEEPVRAEAYADRALAIDCGQTISQPYIVALMTQALALRGTERVLEIGTGSGYQTAILAELAAHVVSIERHEALSRHAAATLAELGYANVKLVVGDGSLGWPPESLYDSILVTAAAATPPQQLIEQLKPDGILVIPLGDREQQMLQAIRKVNGETLVETLSACRFVPLVGVAGWPGASRVRSSISLLQAARRPQREPLERGMQSSLRKNGTSCLHLRFPSVIIKILEAKPANNYHPRKVPDEQAILPFVRVLFFCRYRVDRHDRLARLRPQGVP